MARADFEGFLAQRITSAVNPKNRQFSGFGGNQISRGRLFLAAERNAGRVEVAHPTRHELHQALGRLPNLAWMACGES